LRVVRGDDTESRRGPEEWFTGVVWMDPAPAEPPEAGVFRVLFEPGARTNWHVHPEGQILYVVAGRGRVRSEGGPVEEVGAGDTVCFAPGERHWHGAAPDSFMVHVAVNPAANSAGDTEWMEPVTDEEYGAG
jgi:quercetin dioxygenase-like cupin family protein